MQYAVTQDHAAKPVLQSLIAFHNAMMRKGGKNIDCFLNQAFRMRQRSLGGLLNVANPLREDIIAHEKVRSKKRQHANSDPQQKQDYGTNPPVQSNTSLTGRIEDRDQELT